MRRRPYLVVELLVVAFLLVIFDAVANFAKLRATAAYAHGRDMLRLSPDGLELTANHWFAHHLTWLHGAASYYYDLAHINVTMIVLVTCWWFTPEVYRRARNSLVLVNVIGLLVFYLYPVAPPRLLPGAGFIDIVGRSGTWGASPHSVDHANAFGSMPSLHTAWAVWCALTLMTMTRRRWLWTLGWLHVAVTVVVVIATGNHYLTDVVSGALTIGVCWVAVPLIRPSQPEPVESAPALVVAG